MKYRGIPLAAILLLCVIAYLPGLTGGFMFDDYAHIVNNPYFSDSIGSISDLEKASWSGSAGPLKRPVAMASFALNSMAFDNWPMGYKITNLLIHLINGVLVFFAARIVFSHVPNLNLDLLGQKKLAVFVSALWLLHPINLTTVLYVVQRMTSLSALFSFIAIIFYCWGREKIIERHRRIGFFLILIGSPLAIVLGAFSKENALLVIPLLLIIEYLLYDFRGFGNEITDRNIKRTVIWGSVSVLVLAGLIVLFRQELITAGFKGRPFTLLERVLTECRVLWFYVILILLPRLNGFSLYHDDFLISANLTDPITTLVAVIGILLSLAVIVAARRRLPLISLGLAWFLIGHAMESSIIPLELVHEHRNYFPSFGIFLILAVGIQKFSVKFLDEQRLRVAVPYFIIVIVASLTLMRASAWSDPVTLAVTEAEHHPQSYRSVYAAARAFHGLYIMREDPEYYQRAISYLQQAAELDPTAKLPHFGLLRLAYYSDQPVDPMWHKELVRRLEHSFFGHTDWIELHRIVRCHAESEHCKIPKQNVNDYYQAALKNSTASRSSRSQLLLNYAIFLINESSDYASAIPMLDEAISLVPNKFTLRMTRAEILGLSGNIERLREEIQTLEKGLDWLDPHEYSKEQVARLRTRFLASN